MCYDITKKGHGALEFTEEVLRIIEELKKIRSYSEEEIEHFEHLSDINILLNSKGVLKNLSRGQIRTLKRRGLVVNRGRTRGFDRYSDKGLKLLKELKLI